MGRFDTDLMFATRALEDRFRELISTDQEVGGWFVVKTECSRYWNDSQHDHRVIHDLSFNWIDVIDDVIVVPNVAGDPRRSWSTANLAQAKETAYRTAKFHHSATVFWHSHPGGSKYQNLSIADIHFALEHLGGSHQTHAQICVATLGPLRVIQYDVRHYDLSVDVTRGEFHSWRKKALRKFWKGFE